MAAARQVEVISGVVVEVRGDASAGTAPAPAEGAAIANVTSIPQFGDALVDRIVQMSINGSGKEFREKLLNEKLAVANQSLDAEKQRRQVERRLAAIRSTTPADPAVRKQMTETFQTVSASVAAQLNGLWKNANGILGMLNAEHVSQDKLLYMPQPLVSPVVRSSPFNFRFMAPLVGGLTILGAFAGFAAYLIQQALGRRKTA